MRLSQAARSDHRPAPVTRHRLGLDIAADDHGLAFKSARGGEVHSAAQADHSIGATRHRPCAGNGTPASRVDSPV